MATLEWLLPGDPATRTGGYLYDARLRRELSALGWEVPLHSLDQSFPMPDATALAHARAVLASLPSGALVLIDGLALGAMPDLVAAERGRLRMVGLVHHPLAAETGLDADTAADLAASERRALAVMRRVVATSASTARTLTQHYGVDPSRLDVVEPGTDPAPLARGSLGHCVEMLCVATLTPRKGHSVLVEALATLQELPWRLRCIGSLERDRQTVAEVRRLIARHGLARRVGLEGELPPAALHDCYDGSDLLVLSTLHEGYGMVLAEGLARGLPVVSTTAGAVPDTVGREAGLLVAPGDATALAAALRRFLTDAALRTRLRAGARLRRATLPSWPDAARAMAALLEQRVAGA